VKPGDLVVIRSREDLHRDPDIKVKNVYVEGVLLIRNELKDLIKEGIQ
jgi:hypothetical protein